jgi:hypothetical protein
MIMVRALCTATLVVATILAALVFLFLIGVAEL